MPPLLRHLLACACASATLFAADPAKLAAFEALPSSNPYRDILLRVENLPATDREALSDWLSPSDETTSPAPTLTSDQLAIVTEIASALRSAASTPPATAADWPLIPNPNDPDNPAVVTLAGVGSVRELAQLAVRVADELPPSDAINTYAAVAQLGRQQRAGATLIEQLTGVAIEGIAQAGAAARLGTFSVPELRQLSERWSSLHPAPQLEVAFAGERNSFFRPLVENILAPGLRELLAATPPPLEEDFTRKLRLSGLADLGDRTLRITLENTLTATSFALSPGMSVEGIELLNIDFDHRLAVIRHGTQEAVIQLESKRIVPRKSAATRLREFFGDNEFGQSTLDNILRLARQHPGGVDGYTSDILKTYEDSIDRQLALADSPVYPAALSAPVATEDPFIAITMPTIGKVARTLNGSATADVMLQAAINHRLGQLHESVDPFTHPDPWANADPFAAAIPFTYTPTPDGGFTLRSRYEAAPGAPYTYKFAAPDAGFQRAK